MAVRAGFKQGPRVSFKIKRERGPVNITIWKHRVLWDNEKSIAYIRKKALQEETTAYIKRTDRCM